MSSPGGYDPKQIEQEIREFWDRGGWFAARTDEEAEPIAESAAAGTGVSDSQSKIQNPKSKIRRPFCLMMPPPNVTGALHLGHSLYALHDVLTRWRRMQGYEALYMPGLDHAGIATQAVVEKRLKEEEGLTRNEIGREALVERIWKWKDEYGARITSQLKMLGVSADWSRARFTLDKQCVRAVYHTFFEFFKAGLIYRGERLVNWDAALQTAVADDEIEHQTVRTNLWHLRYPIIDNVGTGNVGTWERGKVGTESLPTPVATDARSSLPTFPPSHVPTLFERAASEDAKLGRDYLIVATTRPETMLGDTAVAVHPDDERYQHLIGKRVLLPLMNRPIPIIADPILVKMGFGTGCVKVTPAHDPNDYECGKRNGLPMINILTKDGRINENGKGSIGVPPVAFDYSGMKKEDARKKVVADLEALGLMDKIEPYETEVGHSDRSKTPIEPLLSEQWFMKMDKLAELAMEAVRDGRMQFFPERYAKTYLDWLGEKRDWCISRQLWWGHRIPVWTKRMSRAQWTEWMARDGRASDLLGCDDRFTLQVVTGTGRVFMLGGPSYSWEADERHIDEVGYDDVNVWRVCVRSEHEEHFGTLGGRISNWLEANGFEQDPDVLDTWFSSSLWPLATLGWPHTNPRPDRDASQPNQRADGNPASAEFDFFYPTDVLCTGRGIISLWVARMAIMGLAFDKRGELNFRGRVPFSHVYINPTIQDGQGRTMSKSLGNGVDPLDIIELYGTDALRWTMAALAGDTQDIRIPVAYACPHCGELTPQSSVVPKGKFPNDVKQVACGQCKKPFATQWADAALKQQLGVAKESSERFEAGRNFVNKLWQAATGFIIPNLKDEAATGEREKVGTWEGGKVGTHDDLNQGRQGGSGEVTLSHLPTFPLGHASAWDRWILARMNATVTAATNALEQYQFQRLCELLRDFFWSDFCDWYIEEAKVRLQDAAQAGGVRAIMREVLETSLRMLHPVIPFVTEAIWGRLHADATAVGMAPGTKADAALMIAPWPTPRAGVGGDWEDAVGRVLQPVIRALRDSLASLNNSRSQAKQSALGKLPKALIRADAATTALLEGQQATLERLGRCEPGGLVIGERLTKPPESTSRILAGGIEIYVPVSGLMDLGAERVRLTKELAESTAALERLNAKLANDGFVAKAPAELITQERERQTTLGEKIASLKRNLDELGG